MSEPSRVNRVHQPDRHVLVVLRYDALQLWQEQTLGMLFEVSPNVDSRLVVGAIVTV